MPQSNPDINSSLVILIFLFFKSSNNKIQKAAIRKRNAENIAGGRDFNDSSTSSNVIPQIKVVKTKPMTAKE